MPQLTRRGFRAASIASLRSLADQFARRRVVRLERFVDPDLLDRLTRSIDDARFVPRTHDRLDPPTRDLRLRDDVIGGALLFVFNDPQLFAFVDAVTACGAIDAFRGEVYRMEAGQHGLESWHNDLDGLRLVALSLNLSRHAYAGGVLQVREVGSEIVQEASNTGFGDALLIDLSPSLEHRLTPIEPGPPKTAWAGWFVRASRSPTAPSASAAG